MELTLHSTAQRRPEHNVLAAAAREWLGDRYKRQNKTWKDFSPDAHCAQTLAYLVVQAASSVEDLRSKLSYAFDLTDRMKNACQRGLTKHGPSGSMDVPAEERDFIWHHENAKLATDQGYEGEHAWTIDKDTIAEIAGDYFRLGWLRFEFLEWMLVDVLVFKELVEYDKAITLNELKRFFWWTFDSWEAESLWDKMRGQKDKLRRKIRWRVLGGLACKLVLFYVLPVLFLISRFDAGYDDRWVWLIAYLAIVLAVTGYRKLRRDFAPRRTAEVEARRLWASMAVAYNSLSGERGGPSPIRVRNELSRVADQGAVWHPIIWAILEHACRRDPPLWSFYESNAFLTIGVPTPRTKGF